MFGNLTLHKKWTDKFSIQEMKNENQQTLNYILPASKKAVRME